MSVALVAQYIMCGLSGSTIFFHITS